MIKTNAREWLHTFFTPTTIENDYNSWQWKLLKKNGC